MLEFFDDFDDMDAFGGDSFFDGFSSLFIIVPIIMFLIVASVIIFAVVRMVKSKNRITTATSGIFQSVQDKLEVERLKSEVEKEQLKDKLEQAKQPSTIECPYCKTKNKFADDKCKACGANLH